MIAIAAGALTLTTIGLLVALLLTIASRRFVVESDTVVTEINRLLPQTQCAQCGYPGCRPYAEAIANGAPINRCPPGGEQTIKALAQLLGRSAVSLDPDYGKPALPQVARVRESECIGCTLCIRACPVDAIIGAQGFMHTVIESECTGCELCLPPCPVDCIDLVPLARPGHTPAALPTPVQMQLECIRCDRCEAVCPKELAPQNLYWYRDDDKTLAALHLDNCIECRLCDRACPSELPLTHTFREAKQRSKVSAEQATRALHAQERFETRLIRLQGIESVVRTRPSPAEAASLLASIRQQDP